MNKWSELAINLGMAEDDHSKNEEAFKASEAALNKARAEMARALGVSAPDAAPSHRKSAPRDPHRRDRVFSWLAAQSSPVSPTDVAKLEGCTIEIASMVLNNLLTAGKVTRIARGKYVPALSPPVFQAVG